MSLSHVILGLLNREPLTGYEVKKIIQSSPFMYWSGNNNQIYKAFVELLDEGFVTKTVEHQEGAPSKNIYTITDSGLTEFNNWLLSETDAPLFRNQFLIKLSLAASLTRDDLENMLTSYADAVGQQFVLSERELKNRDFAAQPPSAESLLAELVYENILSFYAGELAWIQKVKERVAGLPNEGNSVTKQTGIQKENNEVEATMNVQVHENQGKRYLYLSSNGSFIQKEQDALDIISLCAEHDTNAVIIDGNILSDDFFQLRTGLAGAILQKFSNYSIKAAVAIQGEQHFPERFKEMVAEHSAGSTFRVFTNLEDAANWIVS